MQQGEELNSMVGVLGAFWRWVVTGNCRIRSREGRVITLAPNQLQEDIHQTMLDMAVAGQPVRLIGMKGRKMGFSTWIQTLFYFVTKTYRHIAAQTVAHTDDSTADIFKITRRMYMLDPAWPTQPPKPSSKNIEFIDQDSTFATRTAGGHYISSGANINFLHLSELAKWPGETRKMQSQMLSVLNSVPEEPLTIVVIESTANMDDLSGEFESRFRAAARGDSPYRAVFSPWHQEKSYRVPGIRRLNPAMTDEEKEERDKYRLSVAQLAWRRRKIKGDCNGQTILFKQEFPGNWEEAFQTATGKVFPCLTPKRHDWRPNGDEIESRAKDFYISIDFGGSDAFVALWGAHIPGDPGFTVDAGACPNLWRELLGWKYDERGKPVDRNNHAIDAARYLIMNFDLEGHVHFFREMFIIHSAAQGLSDVDHAIEIKQRTEEAISGMVADRSQPKTINLMNQQGLDIEANAVPKMVSAQGEIKDGISRMLAMMIASHPLDYPPPPPTYEEQVWKTVTNDPLMTGVLTFEELEIMERQKEVQGVSVVDDWFGGSM